jgi:hypothetical protein
MAAVLDRDPTRRPASPIGAVPALALADLVEQVRPDLALLEIGSEDALAPREYPSLVPLANYSPEGCFDNHRAPGGFSNNGRNRSSAASATEIPSHVGSIGNFASVSLGFAISLRIVP